MQNASVETEIPSVSCTMAIATQATSYGSFVLLFTIMTMSRGLQHLCYED